MKKLGISGVFALLITGLFTVAAVSGQAADQFGGPGMMGGPGVHHAPYQMNWKEGSSMTVEYKKLNGQVALGETFAPLFKAEGVDYVLMIPRRADLKLTSVKNGSTVTLEGLAVTIKAANEPTEHIFHPFTITANGKTIDLRADGPWGKRDFDHRGMMGGGGMMGNGWSDNDRR
jgi:hypothetical protein